MFAFFALQPSFAQCPNFGTGPTQDMDCDGVPNQIDRDADNDGILNTTEELGYEIGNSACFDTTIIIDDGSANGPSPEVGTAGQVGAIYRWSNAVTPGGHDILVEITGKTGNATLAAIDEQHPTPFRDEAFRPRINAGNSGGVNGEGYFDFEVRVVQAGTGGAPGNPAEVLITLDRNGFLASDVDGGAPGVESVQFNGLDSYFLSPTTALTVTEISTGDYRTESVSGSPSDQDKAVFAFYNTPQSVYTFRCGTINGDSRLPLISFGPCTADQFFIETPVSTFVNGRDTDGDGIPDYLDSDSDNDGITDLVEAGGTDPNNNGIVESGPSDSFVDDDSDGIEDSIDNLEGDFCTPQPGCEVTSGTPLSDPNTDGDALPNSKDIDSDNDGIPDIIEAGGLDSDNDGVVDGTFADGDSDGWSNVFDSDNGGSALDDLDTDSDGVEDRIDLDSDNDGIVDIVEAGGVDANNDGVVDGTFADGDSDGWSNVFDSDNSGTALDDLDTDNDGVEDRRDLDSDNDGIPDIVEAGGVDTDDNGVVDGTFEDGDSDGWSNVFDSDNGGTALDDNDNDSDSFANRIDVDSDNDGIADVIEAQETDNYIAPSGNDADGDGIDDSFDVDFNASNRLFSNPVNTDENNIPSFNPDTNPDYLDTDSDGDGVSDQVESGETADVSGTDTDGDGLLDDYDNYNLTTPPGSSTGTNADNDGQTATSPFPTGASGGNNPTNTGPEPDWRFNGLIVNTNLSSVCADTDIPTLEIEVEAIGFDPSGITAEITWTAGTFDASLPATTPASALVPVTVQNVTVPSASETSPGSGVWEVSFTTIWPGASEALGVGDDWPGWVFNDNGSGIWEAKEDGYSGYRDAGTTIEVRINPSDEGTISYPPPSPTCSTDPPDTVFIQITDGDWNTGSNWREGQVPTLNDDAYIASDVQSTIDQNSEVRNLFLIEGSTEETSVTISNTITLNVKGDLTNNGNFEGDGFVVFDGTATQRIIGDGIDAGSFSNIRLNNTDGLTVTDDIDVTDVFDLDAGDVTVEDGDFITFKSNATKTAIVGDSNGGNINGCVVVERFIPQERAFRYMSSPVTTDSPGCNHKPSINANLQEGEQVTNNANYPTASANAIQGFGTHITGSQYTAPVSSGLDATDTGNPSMFLYNNIAGDFNPVLDTRNESLRAGQDFLLMVRGDRTLNLNVNNTQTGPDTTLRFTGELFTNVHQFAVTSGNTNDLNTNASPTPNPDPDPVYNSIGNPYHANVDLGELLLDHSADILKTRAYVYDPHASGDFGAWITLTFDASGNLSSSTPTTLGKGVSHNGFLQANQAFFIENIESSNSIAPQVSFSESLKDNTIDEEIPIFSTQPSNDFSVAIDLYESSEDDLRDGVLVSMSDQYNDAYVQAEEAMKFFNYVESLAISNMNQFYSIEKRNLSDGQQEIVQLYLGNYEATDYTFKINVNNPENKTVYLVDNYLGTQTLLDALYYEHTFSVDESVPASVATDRFELIFDNTTLGNNSFEMAGIEVYPNPVENIVKIDKGDFSGDWKTLNIYDITGKQVINLDASNTDSALKIDMSSLSNGLYILKINTSNGQFQQKLIKE